MNLFEVFGVLLCSTYVSGQGNASTTQLAVPEDQIIPPTDNDTTSHISQQPVLFTTCDLPSDRFQFTLPLWIGLVQSDDVLPLQHNDFAQCPEACLNQGICHLSSQPATFQCVCPQSFGGSTCEKNELPRLTACDESTCRNGGRCVGTTDHPSCACPIGVHGSLCERRTRIYRISMTILHDGRHIPWNKDYQDPSSSRFQKMSAISRNLVHQSLRLGSDKFLLRAYTGSEFHHFSNSTANSVVKVMFDFNDSMAEIYTDRCILGQLTIGVARLRQLLEENDVLVKDNHGEVATSSFLVQTVNPCTSGNHDCSRSAMCLLRSSAVYSCVCNSFTIDVSKNDDFPGRRCIYDGLIILVFVIVGLLLCSMIIISFGCRRTIWYRLKYRRDPERHELVDIPSNYEI